MLEIVSAKKALKLCKDIDDAREFAEIGGGKLIASMVGLCSREDGIGLAAPQIGLGYKFFVAYLQEFSGWKAFINPHYRPLNQQIVDSTESCLTYGSDSAYKVKRYVKILAEWQEYNGKSLVDKKQELSGISSIIFQHETDHINSITIAAKGDKVKKLS